MRAFRQFKTLTAAAFAVIVTAAGTQAQTWDCGASPNTAAVKATLNGGILTISGTGAMEDYYEKSVPWYYEINDIIGVVIQGSVTSAGPYAFAGCGSLISVTIGNSVTSIGAYAFAGCINLTSVTIGGSAASIGSGAFRNCGALSSITFPSSVTTIGEQAFFACGGLTSVTIPNNVTSIRDSAFAGCGGLTSVTVGNRVTSIGRGAFSGCGGLTSVTIPGNVTSIEGLAFFACSSLTSITIPNNVTSIRDSTFYGCGGLTSITLPGSVTSIGSGAFRNCGGLTSITLPGSVTSIGSGAFRGCGGLTAVTFPGSVASIGSGAFRDCGGLTAVTFPGSVISIGDSTFYGSGGLTSVIISRETPYSIDSSAFGKVSACLYVPQTAVAAYSSANVWKNFSCIKAIELMLSVTFNPQGGSAVSQQRVGDGNNVIMPADPTRSGYLFGGWYTDAACTNLWHFDTDVVSSNTTLYARWLPGCTVTFNSQGGSAVSPRTVTDGSRVTSPAAPSRSGYIFGGWFRDAACTRPWDFYFDIVSSNITLYAKWSIARTVTFNSSGGSVVSKQTAGNGGRITRPEDPTRPDSYFGGWYTDAAYTVRWDFENGIITSDTTLYARWALARIVTFNTSGGSDMSSQTVGDGGWITRPVDPVRADYYFGGWYIDSLCTVRWDFANNTVISDTTLYAWWSNEPVSVLAPARVIPQAGPDEEAAVIAPVIILAGEFTAGPNPAARSSGIVNFFRQGRRVNSCELRIYDAAGNVVNKAKITDNALGSQARRVVGSWNLTDRKGRRVPEGTYLVRGVITTPDGKTEKVSVIVGVGQGRTVSARD